MSELTDKFSKLKQSEAQERSASHWLVNRRRYVERLLKDRVKLKKLEGWYDFVKGSLNEDERFDYEEIVKGKKNGIKRDK